MYEIEERVTILENRTSQLEEVLEEFIRSTQASLGLLSIEMRKAEERSEREMKKFQEEMRKAEERSEREMREFKEEMREFKRDMNKKWGELSNKMGTVVEDIVSPATRPLINRYFKCDPIFLGIRIQKKIEDKREEFDVIAECKDKVFLIEVKITLRPPHIEQFKKKMERFREFFPEYKDKKLIPLLASLSIDENFVNMLSKEGIYAMAYREWDYMDILNFEKVSKKYD